MKTCTAMCPKCLRIECCLSPDHTVACHCFACPAPLAKPTRVEVPWIAGQVRRGPIYSDHEKGPHGNHRLKASDTYTLLSRHPDGWWRTEGSFGWLVNEAWPSEIVAGMAPESQPAHVELAQSVPGATVACACGECRNRAEYERTKAAAPVTDTQLPTAPVTPVPIRREVSCDGRNWADYSRLVDADPFEMYPHWRERVTMADGTWHEMSKAPPRKADPGRAERPSDLAGLAAAALVSK